MGLQTCAAVNMFNRKKSYRAQDMKPVLPPSPTPKSSQKKSYGIRKVLLWSIAIFITLLVVVCLLSYQQGKLGDNVTKVPQEVKKTMDVWYDGAKGKVKLLANKIHFGDKSLAFLLFGDDNSTTDVDSKQKDDLSNQSEDNQEGNLRDEIEVISEDGSPYKSEDKSEDDLSANNEEEHEKDVVEMESDEGVIPEEYDEVIFHNNEEVIESIMEDQLN